MTGLPEKSQLSLDRVAQLPKGFTLVEVLIAFAILAVALGVAYQSFGVGLRGTGRVREVQTALMLAESKLAEVGASIPLREGRRSGDFPGGMGWQVIIKPFAVEGESWPMTAYEVSIVVYRRGRADDELVNLSTVRLVPPVQ